MSMFAAVVTTEERMITAYNKRRLSLVIHNNGTARVFVSQDPANIAANGFPLDPGWSIGLQTVEGDEPALPIYGVSSSGSQDVRVVEQYGKLESEAV